MKKVALFDFDGTLTRKSTISLFYLEVLGFQGVVRRSPWLLFHGLLYLFHCHNFEKFMTMCANKFFKGLDESDLASAGARVAGRIAMNEAVEKAFKNHGSNGDQLAIVTGGFGYVAKAWLVLKGYECSIFSSRMNTVGQGVLQSCEYICVGGRKIDAIAWARSLEEDVVISAYGNSSGDFEMLRASDNPFWVSKRGELLVYSPLIK